MSQDALDELKERAEKQEAGQERPSSSWYISHSLSTNGGDVERLPVVAHDFDSGEPLADTSFCIITSGIRCGSASASSEAFLPAGDGAAPSKSLDAPTVQQNRQYQRARTLLAVL